MPAPPSRTLPTPAGTRAPELLAPAGDWDCARAAVENGADAIYFGLERFNARMRAQNFTVADLPELMRFLHQRGVKGYVTFNTLVFPDELAQARDYLRSIIRAGVDAAIVQDLGICRLIRRLSPDFPIHASTQMTITSAAGIRFARELGCNLVVLARECSLREIAALQEEIPSGFPLEVFVHGALCVAYSGQCLTSESLGGRSANRGECAQACRMPYELVADGREVPLGSRRYLLSPQDLSGLEVLPELIRLGLSSLKIEGRLKSAEYVANVVRVYRQAIDRLVPLPPEQREAESGRLREASRYELEMSFSRGLSTGWFRGINNQELVHARFGKKRGVCLGKVVRVERHRIWIEAQAPVKPGDGVVFDSGRPDAGEPGGRLFGVVQRESRTGLEFGRGFQVDQVRPGDLVWKTSDPDLDRVNRSSFEGEKIRHTRPVKMEAAGRPGTPLRLLAYDLEGHAARVESRMPLEPAERAPLTVERLREQLGRLGGTPFHLQELGFDLPEPVLLPVSELNRMRRSLVEQLDRARTAPRTWTLQEETAAPETGPRPRSAAESPELIVLVRSLPQLERALALGFTEIYCDFEDPKKYRQAVQRARSAPSTRIWAAPPRIFKPGEEWILQQVASSEPDGILARNYDHLSAFAGLPKIGDFSFNIANALAAELLVQQHELARVTASYDLSIEQLGSLLRSAPPEWFEITLHQHMPMFHMEHCVFCAFLSEGTDFRNCGRPCDRHEVRLRDRVGMEHPLRADAGCRNTVFNSRAQTGAEYLEALRGWGARRFRVEFVSETPDELEAILRKYRQLFAGQITGADLWRELRLQSQIGVTRGQLAS